MSRVARDGLHDKWTPVKLADLFSEVAPDFVDQINAIRSPTVESGTTVTPQAQNLALAKALMHHRLAIAPLDTAWISEQEQEFVALVVRVSTGATDAIAQREAFDLVREQIVAQLGVEAPSPDDDLKARQEARSASELELLPKSQTLVASASTAPIVATQHAASPGRILDTEVIAIYW